MKITEVPASSPESPVVFLLHGFPSTSRLWDSQVAGLSGAAHVVRVDIEGSDRLQGLIDMTTEYLGALKARFPRRQTLVVAHDIGCFVVNEVALARAELVDRQILINGAGIAQYSSRTFSQWLRSYYVGLLQLPLVPSLVRMLGRWTREIAHLAPIGLYRELFRRAVAARRSLQRAPRCAVPTLHVASAADPFLVTPTLRELDRFFAEPALACIKGGHFSPASEAETINHLIGQELAALRADASHTNPEPRA